MTLKFRWAGDNIQGHSGYANNVRELLYAMSKLGVDAKCIQPIDRNAYMPPKCEGLITEINDIDSETHVSGRTFVYNQFLKQYQGNVKSLSAIMVLEGDKLPEDWIAIANMMDYVWTASSYGQKQFIENGVVPEKARIIPHGIDANIFHPMPVERSDDFTFLFVGGFAIPNDRKGADMLAYAFAQEFKPEEKAKLVLKINTTYNPAFDVSGYLKHITQNHPKIEIITDNYTQDQLADLYNRSDVHVLPTRGEAFSMNLGESMACGKPVIVTNWSGHLDFCKPEFSYLIDVERMVLAHYGIWDIQAGSRWALPSLAHLRKQMRYTFEHQDEVKEKGELARQFIINNYQWKHAAEKMIKILNERR